MGDIVTSAPTEHRSPSFWDGAIKKCQHMMELYWEENPDIAHQVQQRKDAAAALMSSECAAVNDGIHYEETANVDERQSNTLVSQPRRGAPLRTKMHDSHRELRERLFDVNVEVIPRTGAHNRKSAHRSLDEEQAFRSEAVAAQIRAWRSMLPTVIRRFAKIPDYRRALSVKHKLTVLMVFGLFAFIFRLSSRREMNRELTGPVIFNQLKKLFPEIVTVPHADTLARALENTYPNAIEAIHIDLVKQLINKKKFKKLLIQGCMPLTIDGTQRLVRHGLLQDERWCERKVGDPESDNKQQYVYVLEANISLRNGLTIPLMTEYLYRHNNALAQEHGKQDCETTAFERLSERLKAYFPRLKIMIITDAMFATQSVMGILHDYRWEYLIRLPKRKLTNFAKQLNKNKPSSVSLPGQPYYRKRKQSFYWENNVTYGYEWQLTIHLIACCEAYEVVNQKTGEIEKRYSEQAWISSIPAAITNLHELLNLGARKLSLIEDNFNTEKNRGYHYQHAFSYDWHAMQGFHYLMRLGHAINALSEFTKTLKKYIRNLGCSATLKLIKETLFSPWLLPSWYDAQLVKTPQLRLQSE